MCSFIDEFTLLVGEEQEDFDEHQSVMYTKVRISPESQFIASMLVSSTLKLICAICVLQFPFFLFVLN